MKQKTNRSVKVGARIKEKVKQVLRNEVEVERAAAAAAVAES